MLKKVKPEIATFQQKPCKSKNENCDVVNGANDALLLTSTYFG